MTRVQTRARKSVAKHIAFSLLAVLTLALGILAFHGGRTCHAARPGPAPPLVTGVGVFGGNQKGALRGVVCPILSPIFTLTSLKRCVPEGRMYTDVLNIQRQRFTSGFPGVSGRVKWFAIDYSGKFTVKKPGSYSLRIASDDGSLVWVGTKLVVNNDGVHTITSRSGKIELAEGSHRIRVLYFQARGDVALQLFVTPPGGKERLWTSEI